MFAGLGEVCRAAHSAPIIPMGMRIILRPPSPPWPSPAYLSSMQIRKGIKPLGMTGLLNAWTHRWTHQYRARVPPTGGEPRHRPIRKHLTFFGQKFAHPHPPPLSDVSHNLILVDIGKYRCLWLNHVFLSLSSITTIPNQPYSPLVNHVSVLTYLLTALLRRAIYP
jgi:hypothetical protein